MHLTIIVYESVPNLNLNILFKTIHCIGSVDMVLSKFTCNLIPIAEALNSYDHMLKQITTHANASISLNLLHLHCCKLVLDDFLVFIMIRHFMQKRVRNTGVSCTRNVRN